MKKRAFKKLLVANRGEIALRIIRSARAMGLKTVAVFSEADAGLPHVALADEALPIGPAEAAHSYLSIAAILEAARTAGADAIHPGYGFLSERPEFARAVAEAGIVFVGPSAEAMATLGDKIAARRLAIKAGVPVIPGSEIADPDAARSLAAKSGYPLLVKAAAGGGGRGMRVVADSTQLEPALEAAAREAIAAFGDGRVFLEKYLARPRHVEIQLLGDLYGKIVALGERECSIQRRHQKLIEESPSPAVDDALRARMVNAALKLARSGGYQNAGTVEFLIDGEGFYFLEINARLQVEHPVTELRFGCDLVEEQLKVAAGEPVGDPGSPRGWAIECRINAEDAEHEFRPSTGRILYLNLPAGPGVRVDSFLRQGTEITSYYDSLLAKIICHGATRDEARRRMMLALADVCIAGVNHTAAFLRDVVTSEAFGRGDLTTRLLDEHYTAWRCDEEHENAALIAALVSSSGVGPDKFERAARTSDSGRAAANSPWSGLSGFRLWERT